MMVIVASLVLTFAPAGARAPAPGTDETAALQKRIEALPPGGTLVLGARTYWFQDLRISRPLTIAGQGEGRTICLRRNPGPFFTVTGRATEATFQNMTLDGGGLGAAGVNAIGISVLRMSDLQVLHCGVPPAGSLASDGQGKPVDGVYANDVDRAEIHHCSFEANARDGFIGIPVRHLTFSGNVCKGNGRMGCTSDVDPQGRAGGPLEAIYQDNDVSDCGAGGLHIETTEQLPVAVALFERNRVTRVGNRDWGYSWGVVVGLHCRGTVRGNTITGTGLTSSLKDYRNGILVDKPGGEVLIEGNRVQDSGRNGISVGNSTHPVTLLDNQVTGSELAGISTYMVDALRIERCTLETAGQWGLWCRLCPSAIIKGNRFQGNSRSAQGRYPAALVEASPNLKFLDNDLGGPPESLGLELGSSALAPLTRFEGNTFEGRRSHPRLSNFKSSN